MDKNSTFDFHQEIRKHPGISKKVVPILQTFFETYEGALKSDGLPFGPFERVFATYIRLVEEQCRSPHIFQPFHRHIRQPFDYYTFGIEFLRPLFDKERSIVKGKEHLADIANRLKAKENVIFLANHQTEADPMAIGLLLEDTFPSIAEEMIFVAGERVTTDPLAIPFSMGRNLLCIYSKRYIDHPPELKRQKQLHNQRTMQLMGELLSEGGVCIYVAPSGGRDRRGISGKVEVAPFDPSSIKMFYLMAEKAGHPTSFYPMALATYDLMPPPETVQIELGEERHAKRTAIHMAISPKIDMNHFPGSENSDKHLRRKSRADYIWNIVKRDYENLLSQSP